MRAYKGFIKQYKDLLVYMLDGVSDIVDHFSGSVDLLLNMVIECKPIINMDPQIAENWFQNCFLDSLEAVAFLNSILDLRDHLRRSI